MHQIPLHGNLCNRFYPCIYPAILHGNPHTSIQKCSALRQRIIPVNFLDCGEKWQFVLVFLKLIRKDCAAGENDVFLPRLVGIFKLNCDALRRAGLLIFAGLHLEGYKQDFDVQDIINTNFFAFQRAAMFGKV